MRLFYSGAAQDAVPQTDPRKSLGGLVSSTPIPNAGLNAIFPETGRNDVKNELSECRLIVLKNVLNVSATNVEIWATSGTYSNLKIAAVSPFVNQCGNSEFEAIYDGHTIPFQATLTVADAPESAIVIGTMLPGAVVGIWIQRELKLDQFNELDGKVGAAPLTNEELITILQNANNGTRTDESTLCISYT